jgi:hypothetical protein
MNKPTLHEVLKLSYSNRDLQKKGLKDYGYNYDSRFSNDNHQVYWNPNEQKMIFSITGSHKPSDWIITNPNLALGRLKNTSRYQESDKALKEAKAHYNPKNVSITGHSQSGATASYISSPEDKVYTLDKATTIGQTYRPNEQAYRTKYDVVSLLGINHKNMTTLENKNLFKNIVNNHSIDNIKNEKIFI